MGNGGDFLGEMEDPPAGRSEEGTTEGWESACAGGAVGSWSPAAPGCATPGPGLWVPSKVIRVMAQDVVWQLAGLMRLNTCSHGFMAVGKTLSREAGLPAKPAKGITRDYSGSREAFERFPSHATVWGQPSF